MDNSAKKLAVIPFEMIQNMNLTNQHQSKNLFIPPEAKYIGGLDEDIRNILNNNQIPPEIKYKKYTELFNKFSTALASFKKPYEIEIKSSPPGIGVQNQIPAINIQPPNPIENEEQINPPSTSGVGGEAKPEDKSLSGNTKQDTQFESEILNSLPKGTQEKGRRMMELLNSIPNFNIEPSTQEVTINGEKIANSNFKILMNDFMRDRQNVSTGFGRLSLLLMENDIPRKTIINKKAWDKIKAEVRKQNLIPEKSTYFSAESGDSDIEEKTADKPDVAKKSEHNFVQQKWT